MLLCTQSFHQMSDSGYQVNPNSKLHTCPVQQGHSFDPTICKASMICVSPRQESMRALGREGPI